MWPPFNMLLRTTLRTFTLSDCLTAIFVLQQLEEKRRTGDNGARRSSRHADIENDRPRSRDRDKDRDRYRDRDGHRDRGRESERSRHREHREKDREHERDRDRCVAYVCCCAL